MMWVRFLLEIKLTGRVVKRNNSGLIPRSCWFNSNPADMYKNKQRRGDNQYWENKQQRYPQSKKSQNKSYFNEAKVSSSSVKIVNSHRSTFSKNNYNKKFFNKNRKRFRIVPKWQTVLKDLYNFEAYPGWWISNSMYADRFIQRGAVLGTEIKKAINQKSHVSKIPVKTTVGKLDALKHAIKKIKLKSFNKGAPNTSIAQYIEPRTLTVARKILIVKPDNKRWNKRRNNQPPLLWFQQRITDFYFKNKFKYKKIVYKLHFNKIRLIIKDWSTPIARKKKKLPQRLQYFFALQPRNYIYVFFSVLYVAHCITRIAMTEWQLYVNNFFTILHSRVQLGQWLGRVFYDLNPRRRQPLLHQWFKFRLIVIDAANLGLIKIVNLYKNYLRKEVIPVQWNKFCEWVLKGRYPAHIGYYNYLYKITWLKKEYKRSKLQYRRQQQFLYRYKPQSHFYLFRYLRKKYKYTYFATFSEFFFRSTRWQTLIAKRFLYSFFIYWYRRFNIKYLIDLNYPIKWIIRKCINQRHLWRIKHKFNRVHSRLTSINPFIVRLLQQFSVWPYYVEAQKIKDYKVAKQLLLKFRKRGKRVVATVLQVVKPIFTHILKLDKKNIYIYNLLVYQKLFRPLFAATTVRVGVTILKKCIKKRVKGYARKLVKNFNRQKKFYYTGKIPLYVAILRLYEKLNQQRKYKTFQHIISSFVKLFFTPKYKIRLQDFINQHSRLRKCHQQLSKQIVTLRQFLYKAFQVTVASIKFVPVKGISNAIKIFKKILMYKVLDRQLNNCLLLLKYQEQHQNKYINKNYNNYIKVYRNYFRLLIDYDPNQKLTDWYSIYHGYKTRFWHVPAVRLPLLPKEYKITVFSANDKYLQIIRHNLGQIYNKATRLVAQDIRQTKVMPQNRYDKITRLVSLFIRPFNLYMIVKRLLHTYLFSFNKPFYKFVVQRVFNYYYLYSKKYGANTILKPIFNAFVSWAHIFRLYLLSYPASFFKFHDQPLKSSFKINQFGIILRTIYKHNVGTLVRFRIYNRHYKKFLQSKTILIDYMNLIEFSKIQELKAYYNKSTRWRSYGRFVRNYLYIGGHLDPFLAYTIKFNRIYPYYLYKGRDQKSIRRLHGLFKIKLLCDRLFKRLYVKQPLAYVLAHKIRNVDISAQSFNYDYWVIWKRSYKLILR
jgi:hypothetical protein